MSIRITDNYTLEDMFYIGFVAILGLTVAVGALCFCAWIVHGTIRGL